MADDPLPPSLAVSPNIPWDQQTIEQLEAERAYWDRRVSDAGGFSSAYAASRFRGACEAWIARRKREVADA